MRIKSPYVLTTLGNKMNANYLSMLTGKKKPISKDIQNKCLYNIMLNLAISTFIFNLFLFNLQLHF